MKATFNTTCCQEISLLPNRAINLAWATIFVDSLRLVGNFKQPCTRRRGLLSPYRRRKFNSPKILGSLRTRGSHEFEPRYMQNFQVTTIRPRDFKPAKCQKGKIPPNQRLAQVASMPSLFTLEIYCKLRWFDLSGTSPNPAARIESYH